MEASPVERMRTLGFPTLLLFALLIFALPASAVTPKLALEIEPTGDGAPRGGIMPLEVIAKIEKGWHINAHKPNQPFLIPTELTLTLSRDVEHEPIEYPPPDRRKFSFAGDDELLVYEGKLGLATGVRVPEKYAANVLEIEASLRYQACNDTTCLPPASAHALVEVAIVAASTEQKLEAAALAGEESGGSSDGSQFERWLSERGLFVTILAVALLGVGLNLTPCVYPLISVTIAYFGQQARGRKQTAMLAVLYVAGIAVSFSALGVAASLSGGFFGAALQKPIVVLSIAGLMLILAASSFGVFQLQPPASVMRWVGTTGGGAAGALFMGLTMGIVAAPCVGPIVLGLLVFVGSRQDMLLGFLLFFALAVGMGAPYVFLAMAAGSIKSLPRSGEWLIWTERLFGCVLVSLAAYFVAPLLPTPASTYLLPAVIAVSGVYLGFIEAAGRSLRYFPSIKRAVGVAMLAAAVWMVQPANSDQAIGWEGLEALTSDDRLPQDKPTLIDFAAEWCIPCREMDHTTYVDEDIVREAERFRMVKADITEENETTTRVVEEYAVRGVPTVILLSANGAEQSRLVGYVGPDELLEAMRQVDE
jgi:thiol:disulfide interchange protein DsbD